MWNFTTPGIPDELFERDEQIPITKEEIRTIIVSKLRLKQGDSVIDVGCGSGSITIEVCIQIKNGSVYAIDFNQKAIELTKKNLKKFGLHATTILARAQDILSDLPLVDAVVIGGTWGNIDEIIEQSINRLKKGGRLVISTILIETTFSAINALSKFELQDLDIIQVSITKSRKVTTGTMMVARNPITIISTTI